MNILNKQPLDETEDEYRDHPLIRLVTCDPAFRGGKPYIKEVAENPT